MASVLAIDNALAVAHRFDVRNHADIVAFIQEHNDWKQNSALRAACTPPLPPIKEPEGPDLESLNQALAADIFDTWAKSKGDASDAWEPGMPNLVETQPDYSPAITITRFTLAAAPAPTPIPQPARPLGVKMGNRKFAPALGDRFPVGHVWTNPEDDMDWIKVESGTMGGDAVHQIYWQPA